MSAGKHVWICSRCGEDLDEPTRRRLDDYASVAELPLVTAQADAGSLGEAVERAIEKAVEHGIALGKAQR